MCEGPLASKSILNCQLKLQIQLYKIPKVAKNTFGNFFRFFSKNTKVGDVACCRVGQLLCTINHTELLYICQKCVYPL